MKSIFRSSLFILHVSFVQMLGFPNALGIPASTNESISISDSTKFRVGKTGFEENKGQVSGDDAAKVKYLWRENDLSILLLNDGIAYQFQKLHSLENNAPFESKVETFRMDIELLGSNSNARITADGKSHDYTNFYNLNTFNVYRYQTVTYHNIYPMIDWVIYAANGRIKYDFVVHPGGDVNQIKIKTKWAEQLHLNTNGSYSMICGLGSITEQKPVSFQNSEAISTSFKLTDGIIQFDVNDYNQSDVLTIDPSIVWSTYYGGSEIEYGKDVAVDSSGNIYLAGDTKSSSNIASGGHQTTYGGTYYDAFLVKFSSDGKRQWATYYGGSSEERSESVAVDKSGNVYMSGQTRSKTDIASGGHINTLQGVSDGFLVKFNSSGTRQWATYYGTGGIDNGNAVATDVSGNVYLAGSSKGSNYKAYVAKFNTAGKRQWFRLIGDNSFSTFGNAIAIDQSDNVYFTGYTSAKSSIASGGHQNTYGGGYSDAFLVKLNNKGVQQWATYYGGDELDDGTALSLDGSGNIYLSGITASTKNIASGGHQSSFGGNRDAYLVKFNSFGVRQWSTYYGGSDGDYVSSSSIDKSGNIYFTGSTASKSSISSGGIQNTFGGGSSDAFFVRMDSSGKRTWASYYGGSDIDNANGILLDPQDNIYLTGYTISTTHFGQGGYQTSFGGNRDAFLMKLSQCVAPPGTDVQEACESFKWINGKTYTENNTTAKDTIRSSQGCDSVVTLKLTIIKAPRRTITTSVCNSYTVPSGAKMYTKSGTYTDLISNASGCDSILTINLTVITIDTRITNNAPKLSAREAGADYQWLDCNDGKKPIVDETNQSFTATGKGSYAVEISKEFCVDTSDCIVIDNLGVTSLKSYGVVQIFPNPTKGIFNVDMGEIQDAEIQLFTVDGRLIFSKELTNEAQFEITIEEPSGVYYLKIDAPLLHKTFRLIKM